MILIQVERLYLKPRYAIGRMFLEEEFFADTLEPQVRDLNHDGDLEDEGEGKIWGETAIPYGKYQLIVSYSPRFKRMLPLLLAVPNFTGVRIHALNWPYQTQGCIGVGENKVKGGIIHSRFYEDELTSRLLEFQKAGETMFINII